MSHPYQCLLHCSRPHLLLKNVIVAASGPCLHTFNASDGEHLSTWPPIEKDGITDRTEPSQKIDDNENTVLSTDHDSSQRPPKRRKLSSAREDSGSSTEIVVENGNGSFEPPKIKQCPSTAIIKLVCDSTGRHVVAVTGDDKAIRVFGLSAEGHLSQFSERLMPKRPCAIAITPDNSTILCADKFGDVYSLPLKGQTVEFSTAKVVMDEVPISQTNEIPQAPFSPSATSLTVHTKGNREALRQQQTAKSGKTQKTSLRFDHQLLLGHVSLLTDVVCATITSSHAPRHYILTSDRDEHIRVSRGIPHSHIIEGYCLGHTGFVSKLCILPNHPHLLLSGGGDDYLLLWNWRLGTIQQRIEISGHVESFRDRYTKGMTDKLNSIQPEETAIIGHDIGSRIAVSNIIVVEAQSGTQVAVTCEGMPALFMFSLDQNAMIHFESCISLDGNVIDVAYVESGNFLLYSMDAVHVPFSTTAVESIQGQKTRPSVGSLRSTDLGWEKDSGHHQDLLGSMEGYLASIPDDPQSSMPKGKSMREMLYSLEVLRKKDSED